ncbi:MAG: hypothetical protein AAF802_09340 [Planctomycetota bacterium]
MALKTLEGNMGVAEMSSVAELERTDPMIIDLGPGLDANESDKSKTHDVIEIPPGIITAWDHFQKHLHQWLEEGTQVGNWAFVSQDGQFEVHASGDDAEQAARDRGLDDRSFLVGHIHVLSLD